MAGLTPLGKHLLSSPALSELQIAGSLLMRHSSSGRTSGAYLYHAGGGRALYLRIPNKLGADAPASASLAAFFGADLSSLFRFGVGFGGG